ncbi:hypothetical protein GR702_20800 [Novosphingobium sp. FGD1]|uniref:THIF-type NAD/FAD binding fold domain-containing protein n=1 Tax=Novosphingobium silvae TaxID=2692619 RepID=A0A7X4K9B5_9SPHN|nr:ThiF family adenylyltransferase [Novosphingobium silvae]MYM00195.1 hypothetical protein [Novosphingobium silvae]
MSGLRFASPGYRQLAEQLLDADGLESCAIGYARYESSCGSWLVADVQVLLEDAYESRGPVSATLKTAVLVEVANRSRVSGMAAVFIHTHPRDESCPCFSKIDDRGEAEIAQFMERRGAQLPHLAMVIGPHGTRARHLGSGEPVDIWEVGETLSLRSPLAPDVNEQSMDRQIRAFGDTGQQLLRRLHYGVVGVGGTGSLICQQLAHLGVDTVTLIDPDLVETTNLNRVVGTIPSDVGAPKVEVAARMMRAIRPSMTIVALCADVVDVGNMASLTACDFILLCTDSHASRALVNQVAYQFFIPVIDMGVSITTAQGDVTHITGRVQMLSPGLACLTCTRALDGDQIRQELMTPEQRMADRYVIGERVPQPAVISINSTVSSLAITMLLGAVTPVPAKPRFQRYDGIRGEVRTLASNPVHDCIACSRHGALGRGQNWDLPVRQPYHGNRS